MNLPKNKSSQALLQRKRKTFPSASSGKYNFDAKTRKGWLKKNKLQANFTQKHRCKNCKQNISEPNQAVKKQQHITS